MLKKLFVILVFATVACDSGTTDPGNPRLTLSADSVSVTVGANTAVTATVVNVTGSAEFVSRDEAIARVSSTGLITGVAAGTTYIVSSVSGLPLVRDSVRVRVNEPGVGEPLPLPLLGSGFVSERCTGEVAAVGQVAYTATWSSCAGVPGNVIKVWNVAGNTPVLADSLNLPGVGTVSDVQISDDGTLLVASLETFGSIDNNGLAIFDRTNPLKPTLIRRWNTVNVAGGVHTVKLGRINGRLYAFCSSSFGGRLTIVDITNPAQPSDVFSQQIASTIHDVFIRDGILFTAIWDTGLRLYDVGGANRGGTPSSPVAMGTVKTSPCRGCPAGTASVHNVWWFHDPTTSSKRYAFVGEEGPSSMFSFARGAVHVVDVSNFSAPREVAVYEPQPSTTSTGNVAGAHNFVMDEASGILYAAFYNGGVRALDVRGDLSTCTEAQKTNGFCDLLLMDREVGVALNTGGLHYIWGVAMVGNHLYASDMPNGIHKLDISGLKR
jgi:hypothetical protein